MWQCVASECGIAIPRFAGFFGVRVKLGLRRITTVAWPCVRGSSHYDGENAMRKLYRATLGLLAAALSGAVPQLARAVSITATLQSVDPNGSPTMYLKGEGDVTGGVGAISWKGISSNATPFNGSFTTYCIDLIQGITVNHTYSFTEAPIQDAPKSAAYPTGTPTTGMGTAKADEIEELVGEHYSSTLGTSSTAETDKTAFQLAIWNIIYDTDQSVSNKSGNFYTVSGFSSSAISTANTWLADAANPNNAHYDDTNVIALIGQNGAQDQLAILPTTTGGGSATVPVPPAALGGAALLSGLALAKARKRATLAAAELA
jgi:hypothetical protein